MFNYNDKTIANIVFKMNELFKTIKADKTVKTDAVNIVAVKLSNILSPERTNLEPSENVKEIYIVEIDMKSSQVPEKFIDAFNRQINFQTLFKVCYNDKVKYISSPKTFNEDGMKVLKTYSTDWQQPLKQDLPITTKLEVVYKKIIENIVLYPFKLDETFENYIERQSSIKKAKQEIERLTKTMNAEKQPDIRMAMNDKIKQLKIELQEMEV